VYAGSIKPSTGRRLLELKREKIYRKIMNIIFTWTDVECVRKARSLNGAAIPILVIQAWN
jgi:hypothetical protein